jgi:selenocysteine lyase/cysteine desulfurase
MRIVTEREGDYYAIEVYNDNRQILIRVGFDHEPTDEEIDALLQSLSGGEAEWQS